MSSETESGRDKGQSEPQGEPLIVDGYKIPRSVSERWDLAQIRKAIGVRDRGGVAPADADGRISMRTDRPIAPKSLRESGQIVFMGQRSDGGKTDAEQIILWRMRDQDEVSRFGGIAINASQALWRSTSSLTCAGCGKAGLLAFGLCSNSRRVDGYPKRSCLQKAVRLNEGFLFMGWVRKRVLSVVELIRVREHYLDEIKRIERQLGERRGPG